MAVSPFDSSIYRQLLHDEEVGALFTDDAELRAMLRVEGSLAKVQGELGLIPEDSARAIHRAAQSLHVDPADLATGTRDTGVPVPALVTAFRDLMQAPEHAQYLHWGATSQDIMDTGLILRLRQVCEIVESRLTTLLRILADHAETHAELPMPARTRGQIATPTSLGAVVAAWGAPLLTHLEVLAQVKPRLLRVSLAGASGNLTPLGEQGAAVRAALAADLGLGDSPTPWHTDRSALVEFSALLTRIGGSLAKIGEDHILATQAEVGEFASAPGGGSSTMPQKQNPVAAETMVSLFRVGAAMHGLMVQGIPHRQQRDGAAWSVEWHALPQLCMATAKALELAISLAAELQPNPAAMRAHLTEGHGLVYAEAISFELAKTRPRPEAQAEVKRLCAQAITESRSLPDLTTESFPDIDWGPLTTPENQLGDAPRQARAFATGVRRR